MKTLRERDYPKTIRVGASLWTVRFVRKMPDHPKAADTAVRYTLGLCDADTKTIYIRQGQEPLERLSTWVHEALHAIAIEYPECDALEHKWIYRLEGPLAALLADNFILSVPQKETPQA